MKSKIIYIGGPIENLDNTETRQGSLIEMLHRVWPSVVCYVPKTAFSFSSTYMHHTTEADRSQAMQYLAATNKAAIVNSDASIFDCRVCGNGPPFGTVAEMSWCEKLVKPYLVLLPAGFNRTSLLAYFPNATMINPGDSIDPSSKMFRHAMKTIGVEINDD